MLRADLHTHTLASGDAYNTPYEMVKAASEARVETLAITDHGPAVKHSANLAHFSNIHRFPRELFGVKVLTGCEANIVDFDGGIDLPEKVQQSLDIVLAGLHPHIGYPGRTRTENTDALIRAIEKHRIHIITHPGQYGFPVDISRLMHAAQFHGTLLELNLAVLRRSQDLESCRELVSAAIQSGTKLVISSDAHVASELGDDSPLANLGRILPDNVIFGRTGGHQEIMDFLMRKERL